MRIRTLAAAVAAAGLAVAAPVPASAGTLTDRINSLTVEAERISGYDRDAFGSYDRDALLEANFNAWPGCDGYYSRYDGECYQVGGGTSREEADNEVDVDHRVALKEAWDSRISSGDLDRFGGDPANLSLLTDNVNASKGGQDAAEWTPSAGFCHYVKAYVATKVAYDLSVDSAEKQALLDAAARCGSGAPDEDGDKPADDGETPAPGGTETPEPGTTDEPTQTTVIPEGGVQTGGGGMAHVVSQR